MDHINRQEKIQVNTTIPMEPQSVRPMVWNIAKQQLSGNGVNPADAALQVGKTLSNSETPPNAFYTLPSRDDAYKFPLKAMDYLVITDPAILDVVFRLGKSRGPVSDHYATEQFLTPNAVVSMPAGLKHDFVKSISVHFTRIIQNENGPILENFLQKRLVNLDTNTSFDVPHLLKMGLINIVTKSLFGEGFTDEEAEIAIDYAEKLNANIQKSLGVESIAAHVKPLQDRLLQIASKINIENNESFGYALRKKIGVIGGEYQSPILSYVLDQVVENPTTSKYTLSIEKNNQTLALEYTKDELLQLCVDICTELITVVTENPVKTATQGIHLLNTDQNLRAMMQEAYRTNNQGLLKAFKQYNLLQSTSAIFTERQINSQGFENVNFPIISRPDGRQFISIEGSLVELDKPILIPIDYVMYSVKVPNDNGMSKNLKELTIEDLMVESIYNFTLRKSNIFGFGPRGCIGPTLTEVMHDAIYKVFANLDTNSYTRKPKTIVSNATKGFKNYEMKVGEIAREA